MADLKTLEEETTAERAVPANLEEAARDERGMADLGHVHGTGRRVAEDEVTAPGTERPAPLFEETETGDLRRRWMEVQGRFVDDPRAAVKDADALVGGAIQRLDEIFAKERANLETRWSRGGDVSTEDLRQALRRYRSFFDRLLTV